MADLQQLIHEIDDLSENELKQLHTYLSEHLLAKGRAERLYETSKLAFGPRILGMHAHLGKAWMSDDFRDELPDSFWLGES